MADDRFIGVGSRTGRSWASVVGQTPHVSGPPASQHSSGPITNAGDAGTEQTVTESSKATSLITVLSSAHGRMRRKQRKIDKRDLQAAVKHGTCTLAAPNGKGETMLKYTHADVVYITDYSSRMEVTSWVVPGLGMHIDKVEVTKQMQADHDKACLQIQTSKKSWISHTVCVIDQSGSMRKDDVGDYSASRSDVVWAALAIDFVLNRINSGEATDLDVVTVLCMRQRCETVIDRMPTDFILFNKLIDLLHSSEAHSAGNYIPALEAAEAKLSFNAHGGCTLMLLFLSDGKPSDNYGRANLDEKIDEHGQPRSLSSNDRHHFHVQQRVSRLTKKYGRRLSVMTMGFGPDGEDFSVLKGMSSVAQGFGCDARHINSTLDVNALTSGLVCFSSTLTDRKTECTDLDTGAAKTVRDVSRESPSERIRNNRKTGIDELSDWLSRSSTGAKSWTVFMDCAPVAQLIPRVVRRITWDLSRDEFVKTELKTADSVGVAMCKAIFGEGAERVVHRFREIDRNNNFIGPKLVAKESRFVEDHIEGLDFHRSFCKTQATARHLAHLFNEKLDKLSNDRNDLGKLPRIEFLECSVFVVDEGQPGGDVNNVNEQGILVEEMLDVTHYKKWNGNNGYVNTVVKSSRHRPIKGPKQRFQPSLDPVYECEESLVEDDDAWRQSNRIIVPDDVPQAFSHFTYHVTDRKRLVCDLQGVLDDTTQPPKYRLTDPVIHYKSDSNRRCVYGRTDRGRQGMKDFWRTHVCSKLCYLTRSSHSVRRPRPRRHETVTSPRSIQLSAQSN